MKTDLRGTEPYIAPEVYDGYYCKSTDIWFGLYVVSDVNPKKILPNTTQNFSTSIPFKYLSLVKDLLSENHKHRPYS